MRMPRGLAALLLPLLLAAVAVAAPTDTPPRFQPADPRAIPPHIQQVAPAVVGILARIPLDRPSVGTLGPVRWGSGVIFDPRGYILTVAYVVTDAADIQVSLRDGRVVPARLVARDTESGIGVIQLVGEGPWPVAPLGDSAAVAAGEGVATLGMDGDKDLVLAQGSVLEIRAFAGYWEYLIDRAFIVAPYNPAFGGSPLFNQRGEVVGVTSLRLGEPPHVNLAIPIEYFTAVREELLATGRVANRRPRPWIGLYTVPAAEGLVVTGGAPTGPAAQAGFRRGDVILRLNGEKIEGQEDFYRKLWQARVGQELSIVILRDNTLEVIKLTAVERNQTPGGQRP